VRSGSSALTLLGILSPRFINLGPLFGGAKTGRALGRYIACKEAAPLVLEEGHCRIEDWTCERALVAEPLADVSRRKAAQR
jgi:hypothetical protein